VQASQKNKVKKKSLGERLKTTLRNRIVLMKLKS